jgi:hypothetical protein
MGVELSIVDIDDMKRKVKAWSLRDLQPFINSTNIESAVYILKKHVGRRFIVTLSKIEKPPNTYLNILKISKA